MVACGSSMLSGRLVLAGAESATVDGWTGVAISRSQLKLKSVKLRLLTRASGALLQRAGGLVTNHSILAHVQSPHSWNTAAAQEVQMRTSKHQLIAKAANAEQTCSTTWMCSCSNR
jgi:hypothetical protein